MQCICGYLIYFSLKLSIYLNIVVVIDCLGKLLWWITVLFFINRSALGIFTIVFNDLVKL